MGTAQYGISRRSSAYTLAPPLLVGEGAGGEVPPLCLRASLYRIAFHWFHRDCWHDHQRNPRLARDRKRDTSKHEALQASAPVGAHDQDTSGFRFRQPKNHLGWNALMKHRLHLHI